MAWHCVSVEGMNSTSITASRTSPPRKTLNDKLYGAGLGPAHWQVFYDTLERFPDTGPFPAPPQQAAVESALIKNVVPVITDGPRGPTGSGDDAT